MIEMVHQKLLCRQQPTNPLMIEETRGGSHWTEA
jgi:hypothetical protein